MGAEGGDGDLLSRCSTPDAASATVLASAVTAADAASSSGDALRAPSRVGVEVGSVRDGDAAAAGLDANGVGLPLAPRAAAAAPRRRSARAALTLARCAAR